MDCIAPLANAMFGRPRVCDQVFELGGCGAVLAATRGEDGDDYLREWALWGVRNLCAGSDAARREIEQMQPQAAADSQQLTAMGLNVEVDPETGLIEEVVAEVAIVSQVWGRRSLGYVWVVEIGRASCRERV